MGPGPLTSGSSGHLWPCAHLIMDIVTRLSITSIRCMCLKELLCVVAKREHHCSATREWCHLQLLVLVHYADHQGVIFMDLNKR